MKGLLLGLAIMGAGTVASACVGEAQLIAQIATVEKVSMNSCKAFIDPNSVTFFSESMVCPLDLSEIISEGVEVGMKDGHDCALESGEALNGIIVKNGAGSLSLE